MSSFRCSDVHGVKTDDLCPAVVDLHTHPNLKVHLFRADFARRHDPPPGFFPFCLRTDLPALVAGGVRIFLCATYVVEREMFADMRLLKTLGKVHKKARRIATAPMIELTHDALDTAERMVSDVQQQLGDVIEVGRSVRDMDRITAEGKICMLHALEGAHHLDGKIDAVDRLFERGVCQMVLPHLYPNRAGGCVDLLKDIGKTRLNLRWFRPKFQDESGLSAWGAELVDKLLDVGILVDPTHGTRAYRKKVFDIARRHPKRRPVMLSHAYIDRGVVGPLGPTPDDVREVADTGGIVGVLMAGSRREDGMANTLATFDYLIRHGGEDLPAIGSDFDGFTSVPSNLRSPRDFSGLRRALRARFSAKQVEKILNLNARRVLRDGWGR